MQNTKEKNDYITKRHGGADSLNTAPKQPIGPHKLRLFYKISHFLQSRKMCHNTQRKKIKYSLHPNIMLPRKRLS